MHTFKDYILEIRKISSQKVVFYPEDYFEVLGAMSSPEVLIGWLVFLQNSPEYLSKIASQSYLHQNGFDKLIIHTDTEFNWRLRIHIWQDNNIENNSSGYDIHSHSFDFSSVLLKGILQNTIYTIANTDGDEFYRHVYRIDRFNHEASLKLIDKVQLIVTENYIYNNGSIYSQKKEKLHRAIPTGKTITLVLQQINQQNFSYVFKKDVQEYSKKIGFKNTLMDISEVKIKLDYLIKYIAHG